MSMIEVNTAELSGSALDWAVAKAQGYCEGQDAYCDPAWMNGDKFIQTRRKYRPSTDWSQGGPLIEKNEITIYPPRHMVRAAEGWGAQFYIVNSQKIIRGQTPLIAACRAIVAAKLGETVSVPDELVETKND